MSNVDPKNPGAPSTTDKVVQTVAELRALKLRISELERQVLRAPPGEEFDALPTATARASRALMFNAAGLPLLVSPTAEDNGLQLAADLLSQVDASKGAGQVGYSSATAYLAGSLGHQLNQLTSTVGSVASGLSPDNLIPYVLNDITPPATSTFTVSFPAVKSVFPSGVVSLNAFTHTFPADKIADVWLDAAGVVTYELCDLDQWSTLPRYNSKLHLYRIQTNAVQVTGINMRAQPLESQETDVFESLNYDSIELDYSIPYSAVQGWTAGTTVQTGTAIRDLANNCVWYVKKGGVLGAAPAAPVFQANVVGGVSNFGEVISGTAVVIYKGHYLLRGALLQAKGSALEWYFGALTAGLAKGPNLNMLERFIYRMLHAMVMPFVTVGPYSDGNMVNDGAHPGKIWMCIAGGASGATNTFPANPALGDTIVSGTATFKFMGTINTTATMKNYWVNFKPDFTEIYGADSHDSYAALLLWCIAVYLQRAYDKASINGYQWLQTLISTPAGKTIWQHVQDIITENIGTPHATHGLYSTFQGNVNPKGGSYEAYFLMDNCEVYAGLRSARTIALYARDSAKDTEYSNKFGSLLTAIQTKLYDSAAGAFKYEVNAAAPTAAGELKYYPQVECQFWPALWNVPIPSWMNISAAAYANSHYPSWWMRNDIDDLKSYGGHLGLLSITKDPVIQQEILSTYAKTRRSVTGAAPLYGFDAAFLTRIREPAYLADGVSDAAKATDVTVTAAEIAPGLHIRLGYTGTLNAGTDLTVALQYPFRNVLITAIPIVRAINAGSGVPNIQVVSGTTSGITFRLLGGPTSVDFTFVAFGG